MFVSYRWLQEYVDLSGVTAEELADKITKSGIEVEGVENLNKGISGVVIGHVVEREQHPNADKLSRCQVDLGGGEIVQIVCGAPNVAQGQKVAVAKVGAVLPGNFKIKRAKLRGEESNGMICSLQELGIESKLVAKDYQEGIFVFPSDAEVGADALDALNLNDEVLELGLTPNRSDCLSMLGVAHEVAAILRREVKYPSVNVQTSDEQAADYISVKVEAKEDNPLYVARVVKNVKIAPSPLWMQTRLMAAGIRPHNNVVDITNYILLEYGQPLHAFDYDRLGSKEIVVRHASEGEKFVTLDDQERVLKGNQLVITNGSEPVALAGVMGGANSEVKDDRVNVFIEYASGEVVSGTVEVDTLTVEPAVVAVSLGRINDVLGTELLMEEVQDIMNRHQFENKVEDETIVVTVPTRRGDITIEEDIVEEVARMYGYDNLPTTLPVTVA